MALNPEDREDLLAEATGLPVRGELLIDHQPPIVIGFRHDGSAGWYFGADPVFQFDPAYRLRRVYCDAVRYAVAGGRIMRLTQAKSGGRIRLTREPLDDKATAQLLTIWKTNIEAVKTAFNRRTHRWQGASVDVNLIDGKTSEWLAELPDPIPIAQVSRLPRRTNS